MKISTLRMAALAALFFFAALPILCAAPFKGRTLRLPLQTIAAGDGQILIDFKLPKNHKLAPDAPSTVLFRAKDPDVIRFAEAGLKKLDLDHLPYRADYSASAGKTVIAADMRVHFCDEQTKVCLSDWVRVKFPAHIGAGSPQPIRLTIPLKHKKIK